ncbi:MAG: hypothetical protein DRO98_07115 [Archaeoglobales archaeon]|nr:MAG: hypothetical protein DRO98_07115 [Archaeoglobales archaeon]
MCGDELKSGFESVWNRYPKKHDVSDALDLIENFPEWFSSKLHAVKEISRDLAKKRGPAMYGYELELKPAFELFDEDDAVKAINSAKEIFELCNRLIFEIFK